jgi:hypothetical protein
VPGWYRDGHSRYAATTKWQNINTPADFPAVGSAIAQAVAPTLGPVDGVVQTDADGLAPLLGAAGEVRLRSWPTPVDAGNIAEITQHDQYTVFPDRQARTDFLGELITTVFDRVLRSELRVDGKTLQALGAAAAGGHIQVYSTHERDETTIKALGLDGAVDRTRDATDVLGVLTENGAANKADWFLRRTIEYRVDLSPTDDSALALVDATIANGAPDSGEPAYVIGPNTAGLQAGDNRQIVLFLRRRGEELERFLIDGNERVVARTQEASLDEYHSGVTLPAHGRTRITAGFVVPNALRRSGGRRLYRLHIVRQPVAFSDLYDVQVVPPRGWDADGATHFAGELNRDVVLEVWIHKPVRSKIVEALFAGPWRAARDLLSAILS